MIWEILGLCYLYLLIFMLLWLEIIFLISIPVINCVFKIFFAFSVILLRIIAQITDTAVLLAWPIQDSYVCSQV